VTRFGWVRTDGGFGAAFALSRIRDSAARGGRRAAAGGSDGAR
jgi:hypothetical protein